FTSLSAAAAAELGRGSVMRSAYAMGFCCLMLPFPAASDAGGSPKPQRTFSASPGLAGAAFSRDGKWLATAAGHLDRFGEVKLWDLATGKEERSFNGHKDLVLSVAFAPDGQTLASGGWDRTVKLWNVATGKELATLRGHTRQVWSVAFSPDGRL